MSQYDPNLDPNVDINRIPPTQPVYTETIETVVVRPESNTGWWVAGILSAIVLIALFWVLASGGNDDTEMELARAQAEAAQANANADQAVIQGQIAGAQQSVEFARADAARAQAEAARAISDARSAQVEASRPVIIEVPTQAPPAPASTGSATITSTTPQP